MPDLNKSFALQSHDDGAKLDNWFNVFITIFNLHRHVGSCVCCTSTLVIIDSETDCCVCNTMNGALCVTISNHWNISGKKPNNDCKNSTKAFANVIVFPIILHIATEDPIFYFSLQFGVKGVKCVRSKMKRTCTQSTKMQKKRHITKCMIYSIH